MRPERPLPATDRELAAAAIASQNAFFATEGRTVAEAIAPEPSFEKRLDALLASDSEGGIIAIEQIRAERRSTDLSIELTAHEQKGDELAVQRILLGKTSDGKVAVLPQVSGQVEQAREEAKRWEHQDDKLRNTAETIRELHAINPGEVEQYGIYETARNSYLKDAADARSRGDDVLAERLEIMAENVRQKMGGLVDARQQREISEKRAQIAPDIANARSTLTEASAKFEEWRSEAESLSPGEGVKWMALKEAAADMVALEEARAYLNGFRKKHFSEKGYQKALEAKAKADQGIQLLERVSDTTVLRDSLPSGLKPLAGTMERLAQPLKKALDAQAEDLQHKIRLVEQPTSIAGEKDCPEGLRWGIQLLTGKVPPRKDSAGNEVISGGDAAMLRVALSVLGPDALGPDSAYANSSLVQDAIWGGPEEVAEPAAGEPPSDEAPPA